MWVILILILHFFIVNSLEKLTVVKYYNYKSDRPICKRGPACYGMPSGHMEFYGLLTILLTYYNYILPELAIFIMILVVIHRIYYRMHTIPQLIAGGILAIVYAFIYIYTGLSFTSLCITLIIVIILSLITRATMKTLYKMFI